MGTLLLREIMHAEKAADSQSHDSRVLVGQYTMQLIPHVRKGLRANAVIGTNIALSCL